MKSSKVVEVLKTFTSDELKDLEKFAASPYHRKRDVTELLKILKQFYPGFDHVNVNDTYIFKKLYPGKEFDKKADSLMKTLTSDLFFLCKDYLVQLELERNDNMRKFFLLNQLRRRKLHKEFLKEAPAAQASLESPGGEANDLTEKYFLSIPFVEYFIDANDFENCYEMIIRQSEYLVAAALTKSLRFSDQKNIAEHGYNLKTRNSLNQTFMKHTDIEKLLHELRKTRNRFLPHIEISNIINSMSTKKKDIVLYHKMKELLMKFLNEYSHSEKYIYFSILSDYVYRIYQDNPDKKIERENFEIYDTMLKLGVYKFSPSDFIQIGLFRSMLIEARTRHEHEWMKKLIDNYIDELQPDYRESMRQYSMGQYYFATGEYGKALECLVVLKADYFLYKKDLKNLLFRIYYNLGYYEEAFSVLDSLKRYLTSTKELSDAMIEQSQRFVKFAAELLRIRTGNDLKGAAFLKKKIEEAKITESREWLIEKTGELI